MKKIINYLLEGALYIAPLSITGYIIYVVFMYMDGISQKLLVRFFDFEIPGLGFLTLIVFLVLVGIMGRTFVAKPLKLLVKKLINRIPLVNFVFAAFNDLFSAFVGKEKKFNKPVLVKVNLSSDLEKIGFITEENLELLGENDKVAVYFPHSYNFSGELFIVPKTHVKSINISSSEVMKFVISAGLSKWEK